VKVKGQSILPKGLINCFVEGFLKDFLRVFFNFFRSVSDGCQVMLEKTTLADCYNPLDDTRIH
jgi:hypothetical protein